MCIGKLRRAATWLGIYPSYTDVEAKEAETDNLIRDRGKVLDELATRSALFREKSNDLEATAEQRNDDLKELLRHIKQINMSSASANTLLERLIKRH